MKTLANHPITFPKGRAKIAAIYGFAVFSAQAAIADEYENVPEGGEWIQSWTDHAVSFSRIIIIGFSLLGVVLAAVSLWNAYHADDDEKNRHLGAALFAGVVGIAGVIVGWISGLLVPG